MAVDGLDAFWGSEVEEVCIDIASSDRNAPGQAALDLLREHGSDAAIQIEAQRLEERVLGTLRVDDLVDILMDSTEEVRNAMSEEALAYGTCVLALRSADNEIVTAAGMQNLRDFNHYTRVTFEALSRSISSYNSGYYGGVVDTSYEQAQIDRLMDVIMAAVDRHEDEIMDDVSMAALAFRAISSSTLRNRIQDDFLNTRNFASAILLNIWFDSMVENASAASSRRATDRTASSRAAADGGICDNTCEWAGDGECDDGGPGSLYSICEYGSDCSDCGTR